MKVMPPCQAACPVHTDSGRYARLVGEGRLAEAFEVICYTNPFPSVCGHICQRPCEKHCRRRQVDAPVAIRALKHFVVEHVESGSRQVPAAPPADKARVAVVGAGPAGLTAALDLRLRGHRVSIYERLKRAGGMLNVIPQYRLPQWALERDVEAILGTGIDVHYNYEVGRDTITGELLEKGFEAVVVSTGLSRSRGIAVPGFGAQRFTAAIPWMTDVWLGNKVDVGNRVAVIGGGNVAVDVARTARRLGAQAVTMICLESREEMPGERHEVELAEAEGVEVLPRQALKRVFNREGKIAVVELMSVVSVFDEAGRFHPTYDPAKVRTLAADMVILSIGQAPDRSWARGTSFGVDRRGRIIADRETHVTSNQRVFLAGESLRGPGSAIEAVADGHRVAEVVAGFLASGVVAKPTGEETAGLKDYPEDVLEKLGKMRTLAVEAAPFAPEEPLLEDEDAQREGNRCLGCLAGAVIDESKCASCLTCYRVCPLSAVDIREEMYADPVRCQACGLCAAVCPANAIELESWGRVMGEGEGDGALALVCRQAEAPEGMGVMRVQCLGRLKVVDVLRLFQRGYREVTLYPCTEEDCRYGATWKNIPEVVEQVRRILERVRPEAKIDLVTGAVGALAGESEQENRA